jgi:hypothetical protein
METLQCIYIALSTLSVCLSDCVPQEYCFMLYGLRSNNQTDQEDEREGLKGVI